MTAWTVAAVKRVADVRLGKMVQGAPSSPSDQEAPYLRAAHVQPLGRLVDVDDKTMWFSPSELQDLDLRRGDVVIVEGGAGYGRSAYLQQDLAGWGFQNSIIRVRAKAILSEGRFLNYVFQSLLATGRTALEASVATIPHFTAEKVAATRHGFPSVDEQRAIADFLDREIAQIDTVLREVAGGSPATSTRNGVSPKGLTPLLRERREALITAAVTGRIDPHTGVERQEETA